MGSPVTTENPNHDAPHSHGRWRRRVRGLILLLVLLFVVVNILAFVQAWGMTHFADGGVHTAPPEEMSATQKIWVMLTGVDVPRSYNNSSPADAHLAFTTLHVWEKNGIDLEAWLIPAPGKPRGLILMYHGYAACKATLLTAAEHLHRLGFTIEMVDFRGSGGSSGNSTTIGYREADDVAATAAEARAHDLAPGEPLILFGQSMGAAAVLRAVGDLGVRPDAMVIESPYDRLLSTAANRFHAMNLPAFPLAQLLMFWGGVQQDYWSFGMNPAESASRVHCPVLMFHGALDTRVTAVQARAVYDHLAGPKRLEWYEHAGHTAFITTDPARWDSAISDFLAKYTHFTREHRQ
jgi:alpha-beta hydrolase superfamily lysophospholipase